MAMMRTRGEVGVNQSRVVLTLNEDSDEDGLGGLFDDYRPAVFDSFFPFTCLVEERQGFVCLNFGASKSEIKETEEKYPIL